MPTHAQQLCPPPNRLADFLQGKIIDPELSEFVAHVEGCAKCQAAAFTLHPADTLLDSLRGEAPAADEIASGVPRPLVERLKHIPQLNSRDGSELPADVGINFLEPPQAEDEIGRLGHYRVLRVLGLGGMGAVLLAEDPQLGRQVALKVMLPKLAQHPPAKDRFLREARAAAKLKNDHIVDIYHVAEANGVPYLAMELLEGQSLAEIAGEMPIEGVIRIGLDIAAGLAAAHDKGLIHRDIKPGNLWLEQTSGGSRVKILDFGLARQQDDIQLTHAGALVGTPAFMAPEQARGDKNIDGRADLFSLGCVLYLLTTGKIPFAADNTLATLMALATKDPPAPAALNPEVPPMLSQLIMDLLQKDPNRRPATAAEVSQRLQEIECSLPYVKRTSRPSNQTVLRPALIGGTGLLLAAIAAYIYFSNPDEPETEGGLNTALVPEAPNQNEVSIAPDRRAAEWILSIGGKFEIDNGLWIENKDALPPDPFHVTAINLVFNSSYTDEGMANCRGLKQLKSFNADSTKVGDTGLSQLRESKQLLELHLFDSNVTDNGLAHVRDLKELKLLGLGACEQVTDDGLKHLQGLDKLSNVYLNSTQVTDASLPWLKSLPELRELDLGHTKIFRAGLAQLGEFPALISICLAGTPTSNETLEQFHKLRLTVLNLDATEVTAEGLEHLAGHPLSTLYIRHLQPADLARFHAALPECRIHYGGGTLEVSDAVP